MESLIVVLVGFLAIGLIVWWFFGSHQSSQVEASVNHGHQHVEVVVDGGYKPETVVLKRGVPATIVFNRKDPSNCFSHVVIPDFGINQALPVNQNQLVEVDTTASGEFNYACGMNMFHGKIVIK